MNHSNCFWMMHFNICANYGTMKQINRYFADICDVGKHKYLQNTITSKQAFYFLLIFNKKIYDISSSVFIHYYTHFGFGRLRHIILFYTEILARAKKSNEFSPMAEHSIWKKQKNRRTPLFSTLVLSSWTWLPLRSSGTVFGLQ